MKKIYLVLLFTVFSGGAVQAQIDADKVRNSYSNFKNKELYRFEKYTAVGLSLNAFNYFGDLAPKNRIFSTDLRFTRPGLGLVVERRMSPSFSLKSTFTYGRLQGDDAESAGLNDNDARSRYRRNLQFRNDVQELAIFGMLDLFKNKGDYSSKVVATPYLFGGIAVFHHNPQGKVPEMDLFGNRPENAGNWVDLRPLGTEGQHSDDSDIRPYSRFQIAIPVGVGIRIRLNHNFDFAAEIGYRHTFTDYLDDVGQNYTDLGALDTDLAKTMAVRSLEQNAVVSGEPRQPGIYQAISNNAQTYVSEIDGREYTVAANNMPGSQRGSGDADVYLVTSFQLTYIIGSPLFKAKYR